jgi:leucine-rich repeat protein SHOC2
MGGPTWSRQTNWLGPAGTEETWEGVTVADGHVTELHLDLNGLVGDVPAQIGDLSELRVLSLNGNPPQGWIFGMRDRATTRALALLKAPLLDSTAVDVEKTESAPATARALDLSPPEAPGPLDDSLPGWLFGEPNQITSLPDTLGLLDKLTLLDVGNNELTALPEGLGQLDSLTFLDLGGNRFTALPVSVSQLASLTFLGFGNNQLTTLPVSIGNLENLVALSLGNNRLTSIPTELGSLDALTGLDLRNNFLNGLPAGIGALANLRTLDLSNNLLTALPNEIGALSSLERLGLGGNRLSALPTTVGNLGSLVYLDLGTNPLLSLPQELGDLSKLDTLLVGPSSPAGALPDGLGHLKLLRRLDVFGGATSLPAEIGQMASLKILNAPRNQLTSLPPELASLTSLEALDLSHNSLVAVSPAVCIGTLLELDLDSNPLAGPIPPEIGRLRRLKELRLSGEGLSGTLPPELGDMESLESLRLSGAFTGPIPPELGRLSNLQTCTLVGDFSSPLPAELAALPGLTWLKLVGNLGEIPPEFGDFPSLVSLDLRGVSGSIPPELGRLSQLSYLNLADGELSGPIPPEIGQLGNLHTLDLAANQLEGPIPPELGSCSSLSNIDLRYNRLSGPIPGELGNLTRISSLLLASNHLEGRIPEELRRDACNSDYMVIDFSSNKLTGPIPNAFATFDCPFVRLNLAWNGLYADRPETFHLIGARHNGNFEATQSAGPFGATVDHVEGNRVTLSWPPIKFTANSGGYEVLYAKKPQGPFTIVAMTPDKTANGLTIGGLETNTAYYFAVRAVTYPHADNQNTVIGEPATLLTATTGGLAEAYLPFVESEAGEFSGFAVTNPGEIGLTGEFRALDAAGSLTTLPTNPAPFSIPARRELVRLGSEIFGAQVGSKGPGWVKIRADATIASAGMLGNGVRLDGISGLTEASRRLYFPRVHDGDQGFAGRGAVTRLNLINPGAAPVNIRISLRSAAGAPVFPEQLRALTPGGVLSETLSELFGPLPDAQPVYVSVDVTDGDGVAGAAIVSTGDGAGLFVTAGIAPSGSNRRFAAQVASGLGVKTSVRLLNTGVVGREVTVRLVGPDSSASSAKTIGLGPGTLAELDLASLFNLLEDTLTVGSLDTTSNAGNVIGDIVVYGPNAAYASSLPLEARLARDAVFAHAASDATIFTGLAIYNPGPEEATVEIQVTSAVGVDRGHVTIHIPACGRISKLLHELVPEAASLGVGHVRMHSNEPVLAQELFGAYDLSYLSAVLPTILE